MQVAVWFGLRVAGLSQRAHPRRRQIAARGLKVPGTQDCGLRAHSWERAERSAARPWRKEQAILKICLPKVAGHAPKAASVYLRKKSYLIYRITVDHGSPFRS